MHKLGERLQEISNSASKEFSLEKAMAKMKGEWEHVSDGGDDGSAMVVKVVVTIVFFFLSDPGPIIVYPSQ